MLCMPDIREIESALMHIPADDREVWFRVGAALKSELGEDGFSLWEKWSQTDPSYQEAHMVPQWRSLRPGRINIYTLYFLARQYGWENTSRPNVFPQKPKHLVPVQQAKQKAQKAQKAQQAQQAQRAARQAQAMIDSARYDTHPYLSLKGFPEKRVLVLGQNMIVPIRTYRGQLMSLQTISPQGEKRFLPHSRVAGGHYRLGRGREVWITEGYATALSIESALQALYRDACIVVAFSAHNVAACARMGNLIIADNDKNGVGVKYAKKTPCAHWTPPQLGDANDFHTTHGLDALVDELRQFLLRISVSNRRATRRAITRPRHQGLMRVTTYSPTGGSAKGGARGCGQ